MTFDDWDRLADQFKAETRRILTVGADDVLDFTTATPIELSALIAARTVVRKSIKPEGSAAAHQDLTSLQATEAEQTKMKLAITKASLAHVWLEGIKDLTSMWGTDADSVQARANSYNTELCLFQKGSRDDGESISFDKLTLVMSALRPDPSMSAEVWREDVEACAISSKHRAHHLSEHFEAATGEELWTLDGDDQLTAIRSSEGIMAGIKAIHGFLVHHDQSTFGCRDEKDNLDGLLDEHRADVEVLTTQGKLLSYAAGASDSTQVAV